MEVCPYLFCLSFYLLYFFLTSFEDNGLLLWVPDVLCWHSEVVFGIYSAFKCSFDEFVGEKVVSLSYSSAILGLPLPDPQFGSISFLILSLLYDPTLTSIYDYWKNHIFDYMKLSWQSDVSTFKYAVQVYHCEQSGELNFCQGIRPGVALLDHTATQFFFFFEEHSYCFP